MTSERSLLQRCEQRHPLLIIILSQTSRISGSTNLLNASSTLPITWVDWNSRSTRATSRYVCCTTQKRESNDKEWQWTNHPISMMTSHIADYFLVTTTPILNLRHQALRFILNKRSKRFYDRGDVSEVDDDVPLSVIACHMSCTWHSQGGCLDKGPQSAWATAIGIKRDRVTRRGIFFTLLRSKIKIEIEMISNLRWGGQIMLKRIK